MRKIIFLLLYIVISIFSYSNIDEAKNVLIINSYGYDFSLTQKIMKGITESFEENKIELALTVDKLFKEKYYVFSKYSIEFIDGSYEVEGEGRRDLINTLKIGYKQNVFRDDITLGVDYTYANDDVNFEGYSSSKNIINTSVKWEFWGE